MYQEIVPNRVFLLQESFLYAFKTYKGMGNWTSVDSINMIKRRICPRRTRSMAEFKPVLNTNQCKTLKKARFTQYLLFSSK